MIWVSKKLALAIHARQLAEHGGSDGVRDETLLESALGRPQQLYAYAELQPDLAALAASLGFGIARNPPFVDGNKRTAFVSTRTFLVINGTDIVASQKDKYEVFLALVEGILSEEKLAEWLRQHLQQAGTDSVHEPKLKYSTR